MLSSLIGAPGEGIQDTADGHSVGLIAAKTTLKAKAFSPLSPEWFRNCFIIHNSFLHNYVLIVFY